MLQNDTKVTLMILENMRNPDIQICNLLESKMNEIILKINQTFTIFESDKLHSELRILDWIFYQACSKEIKKFNHSLIVSLVIDFRQPWVLIRQHAVKYTANKMVIILLTVFSNYYTRHWIVGGLS